MACNCGKNFTPRPGSNQSGSLKTATMLKQESAPKIINSASVPNGMTLNKPAIVRGRV